MELLLMKNVEHLGRVGDVVKVKPGYARNYLLPLRFAVPVTAASLADIERAKEIAAQEELLRIESLKELSGKMTETSVTIEGRANEEGHLFGSVNASQIAAALRQKGFPVEDKHVRLEQPLKEIGVFDVTVHLHQDVNVTVKVWVVQQKPS
jgi:large subunit ribosomal protein L9